MSNKSREMVINENDIVDLLNAVAPKMPITNPRSFGFNATNSEEVEFYAVLEIEKSQVTLVLDFVFNRENNRWVLWDFTLEKRGWDIGNFLPFAPGGALKYHGTKAAWRKGKDKDAMSREKELGMDLWLVRHLCDIVSLLKCYDEAARVYRSQAPLFSQITT